MSNLEQRIARLERQNRWLRLFVGLVAVGGVLAVAMGAQQTDDVHELITTKNLVIEGDDGMRAFFGTKGDELRFMMWAKNRQGVFSIKALEDRVGLGLYTHNEAAPDVFLASGSEPKLEVAKGELSSSITPRMMYIEHGGKPRVLVGVDGENGRIGAFNADGSLKWSAPPKQ